MNYRHTVKRHLQWTNYNYIISSSWSILNKNHEYMYSTKKQNLSRNYIIFKVWFEFGVEIWDVSSITSNALCKITYYYTIR